MSKQKTPIISVQEFDRIFDEGKEDIMQYLDVSSAKLIRPDEHMLQIPLSSEKTKALEDAALKQGVPVSVLAADLLSQQIDTLR
jgi:hypothetical protein